MKTYNQNVFNDFPWDCTIVSLWQMVRMQYGITVPYTTIDKTVNLAFKAWTLFRAGAIFTIIYSWWIGKINKKLETNFKIHRTYINSSDFKEKVEEGRYFGIWLKHWNKAYLNAIKKGFLNIDDIDEIVEQGWWFWHNHVFGKTWLHEVYTWKRIDINIEILRYWVKKGLWYLPARCIVPWTNQDKLVEKYLFDLRDGKDKADGYYTLMITKLKGAEKKAWFKAVQIHKLHKINK